MPRRKLGKRSNPRGVRDGNDQNQSIQPKERTRETRSSKTQSGLIRGKRSYRDPLKCPIVTGTGFIGPQGTVEKKGRSLSPM